MEAVEVRAADRLTICPEHPYQFLDGDRHVFLVGASDRALFFLWENDKGFSWRRYLDKLADHHLNYVRQDVCSWGGLLTPANYPGQFSDPAWPFARTGPGKAVDGLPKFDLSRFDPDYFSERVQPFLRAAARRGIYVELTLFEELRWRDFPTSLYATNNNINSLGVRPGRITVDKALGNDQLLLVQHNYLDKVITETAPFGNVIYEIANECGGQEWVEHMIDYIANHPRYQGQLISAGEQNSAFDPRSGNNHLIAKHRGGGGLYATNEDVRNHHVALQRFRVGKPIVHNEYFLFANRSTDDVSFPRKMMWGDFTAGGHSNFFDFRFWRGTGRTTEEGEPSQSPPAVILRGAEFLVRFVAEEQIPFWACEPEDDLTEVLGKDGVFVFTLAHPGSVYLCYVLGDGPLRIAVDLQAGAYSGIWFDPKSGRYLRSFSVKSEEACTELDSPAFDEDVVLYLRKAL